MVQKRNKRDGGFRLSKYPYAIVRKCKKCGKTWVCKGEGYLNTKEYKETGKCPWQDSNDECECESCQTLPRVKGCEEILKSELIREVVEFD